MPDDIQEPKEYITWLSRFSIAFLLFFVFLIGVFIGGTSLHDPDTCWLLATGRWIVDHQALPITDPFSFTYKLTHASPPILYQWLAEVLFYLVYKIGSLTGFMMFVAVLITFAFVVIPLRLFGKARVSNLLALALIVLSASAACFHFLARPEILSYLFFSCLITLMVISELSNQHRSAKLLITFVLMLLWANTHSGFTIGLIVLFIYALVKIAENSQGSQPTNYLRLQAVEMLVCSLFATLCTPWTVALWQYLPHLFFMTSNSLITELRPITIVDLGEFTYYPFIALWLFVLCLIINCWRSKGQEAVGIFTLALFAAAGPMGICCRRLIPFSALILMAAVIFMNLKQQFILNSQVGNTSDKVTKKLSLITSLEHNLTQIYNPAWPFFCVVMPLLAMLGVYLSTSCILTPTLPQSSKVFHPPFAAIQYLSQSKESGQILNDPQFGDVMIWHANPPKPVFIDTRFDMYGDKLIQDYAEMVNCSSAWMQLLDKYNIDLVFLRPNAKLVSKLMPNTWTEIYHDQWATILHRQIKHCSGN